MAFLMHFAVVEKDLHSCGSAGEGVRTVGKDAEKRTVPLWILADCMAFNLAIVTAFAFRLGMASWAFNFVAYLEILPFALGVPILVFYLSRVYKTDWTNAPVEDYIGLFRPLFLSWAAIIMVAYIWREGPAGRLPSSVMLMSLPIGAIYVIGWRFIARRVIWAKRLSTEKQTLLAVGFDSKSLKVLQALVGGRYDLVGTLADSWDIPEGALARPHLGRLKDIARVLSRYDVDEVVVEGHEMHNGNASAILKACENAGISLRVVPTMLSMLTSRAHVEMVGFVPTISYGSLRIEGWNALLKRIIDIVGSILLILSLSPILAFCAAWICANSHGGFLFKQTRVGKDGKHFIVYKFRTMHIGSEADSPLTLRDDPRVTKAGSFLRKWSLDELPQLFNVLFGNMSLVGPRAVVPYVADKFDEFERLTLNVLPGITGLAQVNGRDELAFKDKSLLNLYYITNYSLILDIEIMLSTLAVVARREGTNGTRVEPHPAPKVSVKLQPLSRETVEAGNAA